MTTFTTTFELPAVWFCAAARADLLLAELDVRVSVSANRALDFEVEALSPSLARSWQPVTDERLRGALEVYARRRYPELIAALADEEVAGAIACDREMAADLRRGF